MTWHFRTLVCHTITQQVPQARGAFHILALRLACLIRKQMSMAATPIEDEAQQPPMMTLKIRHLNHGDLEVTLPVTVRYVFTLPCAHAYLGDSGGFETNHLRRSCELSFCCLCFFGNPLQGQDTMRVKIVYGGIVLHNTAPLASHSELFNTL